MSTQQIEIADRYVDKAGAVVELPGRDLAAAPEGAQTQLVQLPDRELVLEVVRVGHGSACRSRGFILARAWIEKGARIQEAEPAILGLLAGACGCVPRAVAR